ncbi:thiamine-phosphate kinase [soil metagenome]
MKVGDLGENRLVASLVAGLSSSDDVIVGPGDDCAVLRSSVPSEVLLLKTDCVVEGVHFLPSTAPSKVGWKAMARALSDIAAMAGRPVAAVVTVVLPRGRTVAYARALYGGLERAASTYGAPIVGGETSSAPRGAEFVLVSVSVLGRAPAGRVLLRSGAGIGDRIFVTGSLGGSLGGRHLRFEPRIAEALWLADHGPPSALMDLSDGLAQDLPRLTRSSGVGAWIDPTKIPRIRGVSARAAAEDGEDYELLCTVPPTVADGLVDGWSMVFPAVPLTEIGRVVPQGAAEDMTCQMKGGWDHFRERD